MIDNNTAPARWFGFNLGFANDGPDLDTVRATLARIVGWTVHVESVEFTGDMIVGSFDCPSDCPDDPYNDWPVYIAGWKYDEASQLEDSRGEPVRFKLRDARITIH
jgi:hypothetical protein